jgi:integrase
MSIRKLKKSWWIDFRFNRVRYRKRSPENSRAGAQAYEALLRQKLTRGESITNAKKKDTEMPTFEEFAWKWYETYAKPNNKPSEIRNKEITLRVHLVPFFGKTRIDKITNLQIEEYKAKKVQTSLYNKSINNQLTILSTCLKSAQEWLELDKIPKIKKLKVPPQKFDFLSVEESRLLLANAPDNFWHDVFLVFLKTGLRKGELIALTWENINWHNRQIVVSQSIYMNEISSTKSNKIRYVDMTDEVYNCLLKRKKEKGFVFINESGVHLRMMIINAVLERTCEQAGLRKITVHTLRHTFASHLAMAGASIQSIQGLLGHSDIKTTQRYAHLAPSVYKETIGLLESEKQIDKNFGQHMVNQEDLTERFEKVLVSNNVNID